MRFINKCSKKTNYVKLSKSILLKVTLTSVIKEKSEKMKFWITPYLLRFFTKNWRCWGYQNQDRKTKIVTFFFTHFFWQNLWLQNAPKIAVFRALHEMAFLMSKQKPFRAKLQVLTKLPTAVHHSSDQGCQLVRLKKMPCIRPKSATIISKNAINVPFLIFVFYCIFKNKYFSHFMPKSAF